MAQEILTMGIVHLVEGNRCVATFGESLVHIPDSTEELNEIQCIALRSMLMAEPNQVEESDWEAEPKHLAEGVWLQSMTSCLQMMALRGPALGLDDDKLEIVVLGLLPIEMVDDDKLEIVVLGVLPIEMVGLLLADEATALHCTLHGPGCCRQ